MLDTLELERVRLIAGLYADENATWIEDDDIQLLADFLGANDAQGEYNTSFDRPLAIECIRVVLARGISDERKASLETRVLQLRVGSPVIQSPVTGPGGGVTEARFDTEVEDRRRADTALGERIDDEAEVRAAADTALGNRIDNLPQTGEDTQARAGVARNAGNIAKEMTDRQMGDQALGLRIDGKQDSLPALTEGQIWLGDADGNPVAGAAPAGGGGGSAGSATELLNVSRDFSVNPYNGRGTSYIIGRSQSPAMANGFSVTIDDLEENEVVDLVITLESNFSAPFNQPQFGIFATPAEANGEFLGEARLRDFSISSAAPNSFHAIHVPYLARVAGSHRFTNIGVWLLQSSTSNRNISSGILTLKVLAVRAGSGGGGGGTTDQQAREGVMKNAEAITALMTRSDEGDEIGVSTIANATQLTALLGSQATNDNAAWVYFTADVTQVRQGTQHAYKARDLAYFAPRNIIGKVVANLPPNLAAEIAQLTDVVSMNVGSIAISPNNIPNAAAVTRDYVFAWEDLDDDWLKSKGVNSMDIWMKDTGFHSLSPWAPTKDGVVQVNVNATEALAIAIGNSRIVPVRAVFRNSGTFVALVNTWLTIGSEPAPKAELAQDQQIGLLNIHPEPAVIAYSGSLEAALTTTIRLRVANPELLTGDIWVEGQVDGQPVLARTKWSSSSSTLNFVINAALARRVGQNPFLQLQLDFYDAANAGNIVESLQYAIPLIRSPRAPMVLQAAVNGVDGAGVASVTLPANYTDWKQVFVGVWETQNDLILETEKHTALLAAQTGVRNIHVGGNVRSRSNMNSSTLGWNPSTRVLTAQQGDRIIYAVLED